MSRVNKWRAALLALVVLAIAGGFYVQSLPDLVNTLGKLTGVAAFLTVVVNFGKFVHFIKDGEATTYVVGLNLLALVALFAAEVAGYTNFAGADAFFAGLAELLALILAIAIQVGVGKVVHIGLSGAALPVVGFSYSNGKPA